MMENNSVRLHLTNAKKHIQDVSSLNYKQLQLLNSAIYELNRALEEVENN